MDQSAFEKDNSKNCYVESDIPECVKSEECWLGIDEAGRGPVLGPMVYGTCFSPLAKKEELKEMGFADSKTLTEEKRDLLFEKICQAQDSIGWKIEILSPTFISNSMLRRAKYNLNAISHDSAIRLIKRALDGGANVKEIYVDTVGDPDKYQAKLKDIFPTIDITVAKKADATYTIVSAASICAKVGRDFAVKKWKFSEGIDVEDNNYGSGYPGDASTKKFLKESFDKVFGFPQFVRFGWSTAALIIEKDGVPIVWEDDEEEEDTCGSQTISNYFSKPEENKKLERNKYFKDRSLSHLTVL